MRRRWLVWVIGLPVYLVVLATIGAYTCHLIASESWSDVVERLDPRNVIEAMDGAETVAALIGAAIVVATQALFLVPIIRERPPMSTRSRPLIVSIVIGALLAAMLTGAVGIATFELIEQLALTGVPGWVDGSFVAIMTLASWAFWSYVLLVFTSDRRPHRMLGRLSAWLLAGTLIELLVVLPMDIMVRRRTSCYCWSGSYYALCIAAIATLWLAGPGVFIALRSRRRRLWSETHCEECGYEKGPQPAEACPECGAAWSSS